MTFLLALAGDHGDLHPFPTRRSSDLLREGARGTRPEPPGQRLAPRRRLVRVRSPHDHGWHRAAEGVDPRDRKSTRLNSSHGYISYAVFCLKKKNEKALNPMRLRGETV